MTRGRSHQPQRSRHLVADLRECSVDALSDLPALEAALAEAARAAGSEVSGTTFHHFPGGGVTGVVLAGGAHLTVHTWPETRYAAVDIFAQAEGGADAALAILRRHLASKSETLAARSRGDASVAPASPAELAAAREKSAPKSAARFSMPSVYALAAVLAACSILYELVLAQTLSSLLGNTVLRYSLTIGCYLGALGIGAMVCAPERGDPARRLLRIELALSAAGAIAVPTIHFLDIAQRHFYYASDTFLAGSVAVPLAFFALTHVVILGIGVLSGFEIPLLLALGEARRPGSTNRVLGIDYLGAFVGSVIFPLFLFRQLGVLATGFAIALVNAAACAAIAWKAEEPGRLRQTSLMASAGLLAWVGLAAVNVRTIEQYFLEKFYYLRASSSLIAELTPRDDVPDIERHRSDYQNIDIVRDEAASLLWAWNIVSSKTAAEPDYPTDVRLYMGRDYQFFSRMEEVYHEWFAHVPPQAVGHPPRRVLVLGGGDGLLLRELLDYPSIESIVHIELDPKMLELAKKHPLLARMNRRPDLDPRVATVAGDAFDWLRRHDDRFDAIYIDMPFPKNYGLSQVYSREFYAMAKSHLTSDGFVMLDAPGSDCRIESGGLWKIYSSTLAAAGFASVRPVVSRFDMHAERIQQVIEATASSIAEKILGPEKAATMDEAARREWLRDLVGRQVNGSRQEFLLALPAERTVSKQWKEMGVPLYAFAPEHLPLAFLEDCPDVYDDDYVNSVFRPTLPPISFTRVARP